METNGHYFKVGLFVILLTLALIVSVFWISGKKWIVNKQPYDIYYEENVTGLLIGSPVYVKGIEAGNIVTVGLAAYEGKAQVKIRVVIDANYKIHQGATANLQLQGITGNNVIDIDPGDPNKALLKDLRKGIPIIPSEQTSIGQLLENLPKLVDEFLSVGENVNETFSEENKEAISKILNNTVKITDNFDKKAEKVSILISDINHAANNFNDFVTKLQKSNEHLTKKSIRTLNKVDEFMDSATAAANRVDRITAALEQPMTDFANYGLDEFTLFITELRNLTTQLGKIIYRVERGPTSFLLGKDDDEIELKK